jgi:hypothetical protein
VSLARVSIDVCQVCVLGEGELCSSAGCVFEGFLGPSVPLGIVYSSGRPGPWIPFGEAPDGSTIPKALREPPCPPEWRAELLTRLAALDRSALAALENWKDELGLPNVRSHRFTKAHAARVMRLTHEIVGPAPFVTVDEPTPAHVHDDAPEAYESDI